jgi:hypothetical protein
MQMKRSKNLSEEGEKGNPTETSKNDLDIKSREENIAVIAYFKAQARGFRENAELDDWLAAEREFEDARLETGIPQGTDI